MLKLGIWERAQFLKPPPQGALAGLLHRLSRSRVSLSLLAIGDDPSAEDIALFEKLMPHVRLSSGVYRTTYRQRFRALNPIVNKVLRESFPASAALHIEDWAASDCLTSMEWAEELFPLFPETRLVASDLLLFLFEVQRDDGQGKFIVEPDGTPLQNVRPPFVLRLSHPESKAFPVNWWLAESAKKQWWKLRPSVNLPSSSTISDLLKPSPGFRLRKLPVIHPEALRLVKRDNRFSIRSHSAFESSPDKCQVIRTMNIYNLAYFTRDQLQEGTRAVLASLTPGGMWIVGRTTDESALTHNVTIFRKSQSGLEVVHRVGNGSEIEAIALAAGSGS